MPDKREKKKKAAVATSDAAKPADGNSGDAADGGSGARGGQIGYWYLNVGRHYGSANPEFFASEVKEVHALKLRRIQLGNLLGKKGLYALCAGSHKWCLCFGLKW